MHESHHVITSAQRRFAAGFLVLILPCFAGCAGGDGVDLGVSGSDHAAVDNLPPFSEWHLSAEPLVRVGTAGNAPAYQFHNIRFAARLRDGRVVVVDGGSGEVRWYDDAGRHRASVGRRGAGPGEFRDIRSGILTIGDTVVIHDATNQRLTWLSPDEEIVRGEPLTVTGGIGVRLLNVTGNGRITISQSIPVRAFGRSDFSYTRDSVAVLVYSPEKLDTIAVMEGDEAVTWVRYVDGRPRGALQMELPFGFQVLVGATPERIVVASAERRQLEILDLFANPVRVARRSDLEPVPISAADRHRFVEYMREQATSRRAPDLALVIRGARDRIALLPEGRAVPPFDRLMIDSDNRIWVRDYRAPWAPAESSQVWTVYSEDGVVLALIRTPGELEILHADSSHVTGVLRDELDVENVLVYRIEESAITD